MYAWSVRLQPRGLDDITNFIEKSQPKTIGNTVVGGAVLSQVLATLVQAANEGLVPALSFDVSHWSLLLASRVLREHQERRGGGRSVDCHCVVS